MGTFRRSTAADAARARTEARARDYRVPCAHLQADRAVITYAAAGYLGVPTGRRIVCNGCGHDFGPADTGAR